MPRIVLDTNMFVSIFVFGGMVETIIDLFIANKLQLYTSPALINEILKKLREFEVNKKVIADVTEFLERGIVVIPQVVISVCRDPKDNFLLELAETAQADYIITQDKDLLDLPDQRWKETQIVKPEAFLHILRETKLI